MQPVTREEYIEGVKKLVALAQTSTGGGRAAAMVVLSAYNSYNWPLEITELCSLDHENYKAALNVIRGRREILTEPHEFIEDGGMVFHRIQKRWANYHIHNRWRSQCWTCSGRKVVYAEDDENAEHPIDCTACGATGYSSDIPEIFKLD